MLQEALLAALAQRAPLADSEKIARHALGLAIALELMNSVGKAAKAVAAWVMR